MIKDKSHECFLRLVWARQDILKSILETTGINFGETKNNIEYHNYLIDNPVKIGGPGMNGMYTFGDQALTISSGQSRQNGLYIISQLMSRLGLTRPQACGVVGVIMAESGCNPGSVNVAEKEGRYPKSAANGPGYGAGICQWSLQRKNTAAALIGATPPIENIPLEGQTEMLIRELLGSYKNTVIGLRKCTSAAQAAATYYCHAVAGYSTSQEPATQAEIDRDNARYSTVGANSQINKGMGYAEGFMSV